MSSQNTMMAVAFAEAGDRETARALAKGPLLSPAVIKAVVFGLASLAMYAALFLFEQPLLDAAKHGGWWVVLPVGIAFAFSTIHGSFTGHFWEACGLKAKGK